MKPLLALPDNMAYYYYGESHLSLGTQVSMTKNGPNDRPHKNEAGNDGFKKAKHPCSLYA